MEDLFSNISQPTALPSVAQPEAPKEYTVSEISAEIKKFVETRFGHVRIKGEIFGAKRADSGHYYLSLKDENAVISAVCWRGVATTLPIKPEDGLEVIATGKITTFAGKSSYQLVIEQMEVSGTGALLKLLEERKKQFAAQRSSYPRHNPPRTRPLSQPYFIMADTGSGRRRSRKNCRRHQRFQPPSVDRPHQAPRRFDCRSRRRQLRRPLAF